METSSFHRLADLFAQLGLASDDAGMQAFIRAHAPLPGDIRVEDAAFWSPAQARLLGETLREDADWAEVVDHLSLVLRRA